jgi:hypothetical protein
MFTVQEELPPSAQTLSATQRAFLLQLADLLEEAPDFSQTVQPLIFAAARRTPIPQAEAFQAIYQVFLGKERGPKAGSLIPFLDRSFVIQRLRALPCSRDRFLQESSVPAESFLAWLEEKGDAVESLRISYEFHSLRGEDFVSPEGSFQVGKGMLHCQAMIGEELHLFRILFSTCAGLLINALNESKVLMADAEGLVQSIRQMVEDTLVDEEVMLGVEVNDVQLAVYRAEQ